jgi:hypothetical protein
MCLAAAEPLGQRLRRTATALLSMVAVSAGIGLEAALCGISQVWPSSVRRSRLTVASPSMRAATMSPEPAASWRRTVTMSPESRRLGGGP